MATVDAVVFDVGETLVDETAPWSRWADAIGVPRLTFLAALGAIIARGGHHREVFELFRPGVDLAAEAERAGLGAGWPAPGRDELYPDAVPALQDLAGRGYRLGIAANQPAATAAVMRGLGVPLELVATSSEWGLAKPDPRFFARLAGELALPTNRIAYVGDRLDNDIRPAHAAGMSAIWIRRGPWAWIQGGRGRPAEAAAVIDGLAELPSTLATLDR